MDLKNITYTEGWNLAPSAEPERQNYFMERCREHVPVVEKGQFGADMKVELLNDGPFTLMLDSRELFGK